MMLFQPGKIRNDTAITFKITVPSDTPQNSTVSLQLNPFVWMEPLPMWSLGNNQWLYVLNSPMEFIKNSYFRFILNDQNVNRNDIATADPTSLSMKIDYTNPEIDYAVQKWSTDK